MIHHDITYYTIVGLEVNVLQGHALHLRRRDRVEPLEVLLGEDPEAPYYHYYCYSYCYCYCYC